MKLTPTAVTYEFTHPSGYNFTVEASEKFDGYGQSLGWTAQVLMSTTGLISAETAVKHLGLSAQEFLKQLKAKGAKT